MLNRVNFVRLILIVAANLQFQTSMGEFTSYRPRNPIVRAVLARLQEDKVHHDNKHEHWYRVDTSRLLSENLCDKFIPFHQDTETEEFLDTCIEKSDRVFTQIFQSVASTLLGLFLTKTSINGLLGRGSMFVLSHQQFETLLGLSPIHKEQNLLDLGAGDGEVTKIMASYFTNVYATEMSPPMRRLLSYKGFQLLDVDSWNKNNITFDVISCLNLLDRCNKPVSLLRSMHQSLRPERGRVLVAVVIPFKPYVEFDSQDNIPTENLQITGETFEEQVSQLEAVVFQPAGFQVEAFTRLPYLSEGDMQHSFYVLTDAVFVLKSLSKVTVESL